MWSKKGLNGSSSMQWNWKWQWYWLQHWVREKGKITKLPHCTVTSLRYQWNIDATKVLGEWNQSKPCRKLHASCTFSAAWLRTSRNRFCASWRFSAGRQQEDVDRGHIKKLQVAMSFQWQCRASINQCFKDVMVLQSGKGNRLHGQEGEAYVD